MSEHQKEKKLTTIGDLQENSFYFFLLVVHQLASNDRDSMFKLSHIHAFAENLIKEN